MWGSEVPISPPFNDRSLFSNVPLPYLPECFFLKCNFVRIPKLFFSVNSVRYFITAFPVADPLKHCLLCKVWDECLSRINVFTPNKLLKRRPNFWDCEQSSVMWPFKWDLFCSAFEWSYFFVRIYSFGQHFESRQKRIQNCISFLSGRWLVATKKTISTGMWHSTVSYSPMLRVCFLERNGLFIMLKRFLFIGYLALLVPLHQRRYIPMFTKNNWSQHLLYSWWTQSRVTRDFVVLARKPTRA